MANKNCAKCGQPTRNNQRYCLSCHSEYMKGFRRTVKESKTSLKAGGLRSLDELQKVGTSAMSASAGENLKEFNALIAVVRTALGGI